MSVNDPKLLESRAETVTYNCLVHGITLYADEDASLDKWNFKWRNCEIQYIFVIPAYHKLR